MFVKLIALLFLVRAMCLGLNGPISTDVHIRPEGKDVEGCGHIKSPCYTMRYALHTCSGLNLFLNVEGPRAFEFLSGPIDIRCNVTIRPFNSDHVSIENCGNISNLFNVIGTESQSFVTMKMDRINISNCTSRCLISISNARLNIVNSSFNNSGTLLKHKRESKNCNKIHLSIIGSRFFENFVQTPFGPSISLFGCAAISMTVTNSHFESSPISLESGYQDLSFMNVEFKSHSKKAYIFQTQSLGQANIILFHNCSFATVSKVVSSPLLMLMNTVDPRKQSTITFQYSKFSSTSVVSGAALYVGSGLEGPNQTAAKVVVRNCVFIRCSTGGNGGAIHVGNMEKLTINGCVFLNNSAANGGALSLDNVKSVQITNSIFKFNRATSGRTYASRGGALHSLSSSLNIADSSFHDNTASYEGHSLYAFNSNTILLLASTFSLNQSPVGPTPGNAILALKCYSGCLVTNVIKASVSCNTEITSTSMVLMTAEGKINLKNFEKGCPPNYTINSASIASSGYPFQYKLINIWCEKNMLDN